MAAEALVALGCDDLVVAWLLQEPSAITERSVATDDPHALKFAHRLAYVAALEGFLRIKVRNG